MPKKRNKNRAAKRAALVLIAATVLSVLVPGVHEFLESFLGAALNTVNVAADAADAFPVTVHFIDIGQGDAALVKSGSGNLLIDGGEAGQGDKLVSYLKAQGIEKLDCVVATHAHADHIGGLPEVLRGFEVGMVLAPRYDAAHMPATRSYENFLRAVQASGAKAVFAKPGDNFLIGDLRCTVLGPLGQSEEINNSSVVLTVQYKARAFLFTGDAEEKEEAQLLAGGGALLADVLKVGHHGSHSSSSAAFVAAVRPKAAVISCGRDNDYGHPHAKTLETLRRYGVKTYRTDQMGTVVAATDGARLTIFYGDKQETID